LDDETRSKNLKKGCEIKGLEVLTDYPENGLLSWCALKYDCKHVRKSFVPDSITNFNDGVKCGDN